MKNIRRKSRNAVMNNVFVYLVSIIVVVFCGFLVTNFILNFTSDSSTATQNKIIESIKEDFKQVYIKYGAENTKTYRLPKNIEYVCFVQKNCDVSLTDGFPSTFTSNQKSNLQSVIDGNNNVAVFDKSSLITSTNIGEINVKPSSGCLCIEQKNNKLNLIYSNERNKVYIRENN